MSKKKNKRIRINSKKMIMSVLLILVFIGVIVLGTILCSKKNDSKKEIKLNFASRINELENFNPGNYYKFGWLQVQGTNIDIPVLDPSAATDEVQYSFAWNSPMYVSGKGIDMLLGHNVVNVSSQPLLPDKKLKNFEELMAFVYHSFASENLYARYTKDGKDNVYMLYAIRFNGYDGNDFINFISKEEKEKYIKNAIDNSIYDFDIDVNADDDLLQLKTCTRMFGTVENQQIMLEYRKIRKNEKTYKYSVKKNKKYKTLNIKEEKM